ncbi:hypothetical protein OQ641_28710 [Klebsiella pneumoniae]|nr:hypothetical protein [Klebsiella pneumoniae]MCX2581824.1 hypothetical protein [Klebsiella pneumoniae]
MRHLGAFDAVDGENTALLYFTEERGFFAQRSGRTTVPQIFIDAQHIGGCDDLYALDSRGGLDPLLR